MTRGWRQFCQAAVLKQADKPSSVPPGREPVEGGDHLSRTAVARRLQRPTRGLGTSNPQRERVSPPAPRPLLGLAPGGVCLAGPVTRTAGELLSHLFTLTVTAVCFCGTVRRVAPPGCYPAPRSVELGLSSDSFPRGKSCPRSPGLLKHQLNYSTCDPHCQARSVPRRPSSSLPH